MHICNLTNLVLDTGWPMSLWIVPVLTHVPYVCYVLPICVVPGVVSLTFRELSKIFSPILCIAEIVLIMRISSWNFVRVLKVMRTDYLDPVYYISLHVVPNLTLAAPCHCMQNLPWPWVLHVWTPHPVVHFSVLDSASYWSPGSRQNILLSQQLLCNHPYHSQTASFDPVMNKK